MQEDDKIFDLSDKTPQEIAEFVGALLAARQRLLLLGLDTTVKKKKSHPIVLDFTTTPDAW